MRAGNAASGGKLPGAKDIDADNLPGLSSFACLGYTAEKLWIPQTAGGAPKVEFATRRAD